MTLSQLTICKWYMMTANTVRKHKIQLKNINSVPIYKGSNPRKAGMRLI